ncbi:hypothetical protein AFLA_012736 [Aspergillus flavus NRRL3357]|nr:hypothetical protein AFLA_012736 [Aspergillus flavus NRRL3357]
MVKWRHDGQPDVQEKCRMGPRGKHAVEGENGCAGGDGEGGQDDELTNTWRGNSNRIAFQIESYCCTYSLRFARQTKYVLVSGCTEMQARIDLGTTSLRASTE